MYEFPIKHFERNLIFNKDKNQCWAIYKIIGFNYDYKNEDSKEQILNLLARFLINIGKEAKVLIVPISQDIDSHFEKIVDTINKEDKLYEKAKAHATGTRDYLKEKISRRGSTNDYNVYVLTKISFEESLLKDIKQSFNYFIKDPTKVFYEALGLEIKVITEREMNSFKNLADEYFKKQNKRIRLETCSENTTQWLIRRTFRRGLGETKTFANWVDSRVGAKWLSKNKNKNSSVIKQIERTEKRAWSPFAEKKIKDGETIKTIDSKSIMKLVEGVIDTSEARTLKVLHDNETSYQAFLSISHIPDGIVFPGFEWLLILQDFPIQTEVCLHISTKEHAESIRKLSRQKRDIEGQIKHADESDEDVPDELIQSRDSAREMEAELKATRAPVLDTSITICVMGASKEELEDRVAFVKEYYEDHDFLVERSYSDQLKLFMEFLPGAGRYVTDYVHPLPPRTLAGSMFPATRLLGDNIGPFVGTTGVVEKNVYLDMGRACLLDRSASAFFTGSLGAGKSFNANMFFYLNVLYGGKGLVFDPKGERTKWIEKIPELRGEINVITLSPSQEDKGKLDPFIIYKGNREEAGELAVNILAELFKLHPNDEEYIALLEAVNFVKKEENPSMIALSEKLFAFDEKDELAKKARFLGRKIKLLRENGMAGLLFGDGTEEALSFEKRVNILQIQNLVMPLATTKKEDYTTEERISTVLMLPIATFAKKFAMQTTDSFKIILFDESWGLKATAMGEKLFNFLARMGRSLYAGAIFIGHSIKDLGEGGIKNAISYKFCFKTTDTEEIIRVLEFLNLEISEDNIDEVRNLANAECLFQDLDGRVGKLKFDVVFEHLIEAFKTTPTKKKEGEDGEDGEKTA